MMRSKRTRRGRPPKGAASQRELGKALGVSQQRASQLARQDALPPTLEDARTHGELRRQLLATQLERERLELAVAKGDVVDVTAMDAALAKAFTLVERRLRAFPGRLAPVVDPSQRAAVVAAARTAVEELVAELRAGEKGRAVA